MNKYRATIRMTSYHYHYFESDSDGTAQEYMDELDHEDLCNACDAVKAHDYDSEVWEVEEICEFCKDPLKSMFNIPCCQKLVEKLRAEKAKVGE